MRCESGTKKRIFLKGNAFFCTRKPINFPANCPRRQRAAPRPVCPRGRLTGREVSCREEAPQPKNKTPDTGPAALLYRPRLTGQQEHLRPTGPHAAFRMPPTPLRGIHVSPRWLNQRYNAYQAAPHFRAPAHLDTNASQKNTKFDFFLSFDFFL